MSVVHELDELLCGDEDDYARLDLFHEADELIGQLQPGEVPALLALWQRRGAGWQQRFTQASSSIDGAVLRALLAGLLRLSDTVHGICALMTRLPATADSSPLSDALLDYAQRAWQANPARQRQIQMSCWSCGLSGRLLKRLGLASWKEAGL